MARFYQPRLAIRSLSGNERTSIPAMAAPSRPRDALATRPILVVDRGMDDGLGTSLGVFRLEYATADKDRFCA